MTRKVRSFAWMFPLVLTVAVAGVLLFPTLRSAAEDTAAMRNGATPLDVTLGQATRGVVFFTAAVNADGTLASCFYVVSCTATYLGTGAYQIDFGENVQATNGYGRWVQPDTLTTGEEFTFCATADRAGDNNAVFINCQNSAGTATDTSFFLFVAR